MELKEILLSLKMIMFGGKGGVGKTSCAVAAAIWAAEHGRNTLIISTDPAHSLGDSLEMELPPGEPTTIIGISNLTALEIDPKSSIEDFKDITKLNPMGEIELPGMGGLMDSMGMGDIIELGSMNPPGIDETLAFAKVLEFIETNHDYDLIIFDTAPTGHTLRFLSLPETLSGWLGKLLKMRIKLGKIFGSLKRLFSREEKTEDNTLELLEKLKNSVIKARDDLTDPSKNSFVIVMIPEEMAIAETGRLLNELIKYNISVSNIVINQLYQESSDLCDFCKGRREMQQRNLKKIKEIFSENLKKKLIEIPLFKGEIRGYSSLKEMGRYLIELIE